MRIVCDTNVILSGLLFSGHCRTILRYVSEGHLQGFTSTALLAELERVLLRPKFRLAVSEVEAILDLIRQSFVLVLPRESVTVVTDDPDDDAVLEAAVAADAELIVSGDKHLLDLEAFRDKRIITPASLIRELRCQD